MGGLGNQMFQYAFGKALEQKQKVKVLFDNTYFDHTRNEIMINNQNSKGVTIRAFALDLFKLDLEFANSEQIKKAKKSLGIEKNAFSCDYDLLLNDYGYYEGYYQNEEYFSLLQNEIKTDFTFPEISSEDLHNQRILNKINSCQNPVFIHIRRGDYLNLDGWTLSNKYYQKAVKEMLNRVDNPTFFVFGQDCEDYIKKELKLPCDYEYIGNHNSKNNKDYMDMQLMSMCKHGIIANSSFSWWAAWLINNVNKVVIAPTPWLNDNDEIICSSWIKENK